MPTNLLEPPKPGSPPAPRTPPQARPFGNHHQIPKQPTKTLPTTTPKNAPQTSPRLSPTGPMILVATAQATKKLKCQTGTELPAGKENDYPQDGETPNVRRQRPCSGGEPGYTTKTTRKKIGRFGVSRGQGLYFGPKSVEKTIVRQTKRTAKKAGYDTEKEGVEIIAELDKPRTMMERIKVSLNRVDRPCFYQVYAEREVRECHCPDGSKCRKTRRA